MAAASSAHPTRTETSAPGCWGLLMTAILAAVSRGATPGGEGVVERRHHGLEGRLDGAGHREAADVLEDDEAVQAAAQEPHRVDLGVLALDAVRREHGPEHLEDVSHRLGVRGVAGARAPQGSGGGGGGAGGV